MVRRYSYRREPRVKPASDRLLVHLYHDGRSEVLCLTTPSAATRGRLRRFARLVVETPSFLMLGGAGE
jgi:hypothetical protein